MSHDENALRALWKNQSTKRVRMTPDELRARAAKFQNRIRWRNGREYAAIIIVIICLILNMLQPHGMLVRLGSGMIALWAIYIGYCMYRFGSSSPLPTAPGVQSYVDFHRQGLEQQRDLARSWRWALAPIVPGLVLLVPGLALESQNPSRWEHALGMGGAFLFLLIAIAIQNKWSADKWQREIDALNSLDARDE